MARIVVAFDASSPCWGWRLPPSMADAAEATAPAAQAAADPRRRIRSLEDKVVALCDLLRCARRSPCRRTRS